MSRRKARILALQALYSYDVGGVSLDQLLTFDWDSSSFGDSELSATVAAEKSSGAPDSEVYDFARILVSGTINHLDEVDTHIKNHLSANWDMERISRVTLAILRISVYSLCYLSDMPASVVIDEAISLAKDYGSDDSFKFINAVLDNIRKELAV